MTYKLPLIPRTFGISVPLKLPPLTWDYNGTTRSRSSSGSGASTTSATPRRGASTETDTSNASSITAKPDRPPPLPSSSSNTPRKADQQATVRHGVSGGSEDELPDTTMLDSVVLPAIASLFPRVSTQEARIALSALQRAFTEAERTIPGVTLELVNEIVDSVEHVEDDR
ncbi:hypothetical protein BC834DRAFT_444611 [Gloeopeniophorella convolvens]|nr:hypothetical protein BC834DRAFT_444611 [Gloeopeniophorella convolvens]